MGEEQELISLLTIFKQKYLDLFKSIPIDLSQTISDIQNHILDRKPDQTGKP